MDKETLEVIGICLIGVFGFLAIYCAKKLVGEVKETVEEYEPPMGGWDEVYDKPPKEEPFEGWRIGQ